MAILKIPKPNKDDHLFNRRILAYYGLIFTVYWNHLILLLAFILAVKGNPFETAVVIAFQGVPTTLAGMGFWKYLKASEKDDEKQIDTKLGGCGDATPTGSSGMENTSSNGS